MIWWGVGMYFVWGAWTAVCYYIADRMEQNELSEIDLYYVPKRTNPRKLLIILLFWPIMVLREHW